MCKGDWAGIVFVKFTLYLCVQWGEDATGVAETQWMVVRYHCTILCFQVCK